MCGYWSEAPFIWGMRVLYIIAAIFILGAELNASILAESRD